MPDATPGTPGLDFRIHHFPITIVMIPEVAWLSVHSVTREQSSEEGGPATLFVTGVVQMHAAADLGFRLGFTDSEDVMYEDSGGVSIGPREEGDEIPYEISVEVPADVTLKLLNIMAEGDESRQVDYHIDLPVDSIPRR